MTPQKPAKFRVVPAAAEILPLFAAPAGARHSVRGGGANTADALTRAAAVLCRLEQNDVASWRRLLNLIGTVLTTNLGRAALPESAIAAVAAMRSATPIDLRWSDDAPGFVTQLGQLQGDLRQPETPHVPA